MKAHEVTFTISFNENEVIIVDSNAPGQRQEFARIDDAIAYLEVAITATVESIAEPTPAE